MIRRGIILIGLIYPLLACVHVYRAPRPIPTVPSQLGTHRVAPFNSIMMTGRVNVHLHTAAIVPRVLIHGDPRDTAKMTWVIDHQTLNLTLPKKYPQYGPIDLDISTHNLVALSYKGQGFVSGQRLRGKQFVLSINNEGATALEGQLDLQRVILAGKGTVSLKDTRNQGIDLLIKDKVKAELLGVYRLKSLQMTNASTLSIYWIKSPRLQVLLRDKASVQIAGTAALLQVECYDSTRFNGRYLRTTEAFVKTHQHSVADIAVLNKQHSLAQDSSNIYYHHLPVFKTDFMGSNGTVLEIPALKP